jgi:cytochrome c-type biogenesis protein CcmE
MSKGAQIVVGATAAALLLVWYGITNLEAGASYQYYKTLEEFRAADPSLMSESIRVHGFVVAGSIERDVHGKRVLFAVQNDPPHTGIPVNDSLRVVYLSLETPDLFKDGAEVVVEGSLDDSGGETVFLASNLLAKCPSKFEAQESGAASL